MPPFAGVAVNVTFVPAQIVLPVFAEMLTDGVTVALTVIKMGRDVIAFGLAQDKDEVITTFTSSLFANVEFE